MPEVEIRFENFSVDAEVYSIGRAMPTLTNSVMNVIEVSFQINFLVTIFTTGMKRKNDSISLQGVLSRFMLFKSKKSTLNILKNVNGIIKPGR